jgi:hypothetical protein
MQLTGGAGGRSGGDGLLRSNAGIMFGVGAATPATGGSDTTSVIPGCFIAPLRIRATVLRLQPARSVPRHGGYTTGSAPRGCGRAQDRLPRGAPAAAPQRLSGSSKHRNRAKSHSGRLCREVARPGPVAPDTMATRLPNVGPARALCIYELGFKPSGQCSVSAASAQHQGGRSRLSRGTCR